MTQLDVQSRDDVGADVYSWPGQPMTQLDVQSRDDVGADVYPWPGPPMTQLDVQSRDDVGADVYPWPGPPMTQLDVQRDAMKIGRVLHISFSREDIRPSSHHASLKGANSR